MTTFVINVCIAALCTTLAFFTWLKSGRDGVGKGTIVPEYEPPTDLSPAEVGVLNDYKATDREVTATLIDLSLRAYISIKKLERRHLFGNRTVYEFTLLNDDVLNLKDHEKAVLNGLFGVVGAKYAQKIQSELTNPKAVMAVKKQYPAGVKSLVGQSVAIDELKPYFFQYVNEAQTSLYRSLTHDGYFKSDPISSGMGLVFLAVMCCLFALVTYPHYIFGCGFGAATLIGFARVMKARSVRGTLAQEYIRGFSLYIRTVEVSRLRSLQAPSTAKIDSQKVVQLYKTYLPYAIALGLESEWTDKFNESYVQQVGFSEDATDLFMSVAEMIDSTT